MSAVHVYPHPREEGLLQWRIGPTQVAVIVVDDPDYIGSPPAWGSQGSYVRSRCRHLLSAVCGAHMALAPSSCCRSRPGVGRRPRCLLSFTHSRSRERNKRVTATLLRSVDLSASSSSRVHAVTAVGFQETSAGGVRSLWGDFETHNAPCVKAGASIEPPAPSSPSPRTSKGSFNGP